MLCSPWIGNGIYAEMHLTTIIRIDNLEINDKVFSNYCKIKE